MEKDDFIALLGDVGGTNVRLVLNHIRLSDRDHKTVIKEQTIDSRTVESFEEAVRNFLKVSHCTILRFEVAGEIRDN